MSIKTRVVFYDGSRHKRYHPVCDCCGRELGPELFYIDAIYAMIFRGWKLHNSEIKRTDYCPKCIR